MSISDKLNDDYEKEKILQRLKVKELKELARKSRTKLEKKGWFGPPSPATTKVDIVSVLTDSTFKERDLVEMLGLKRLTKEEILNYMNTKQLRGLAKECGIPLTVESFFGTRRATSKGDMIEVLGGLTENRIRKYANKISLIESPGKAQKISKKIASHKRSRKPPKGKEKQIFIVHGRNRTPALELARLVERRYPTIDAILLSERPHRGRTLIEKLEDYSEVDFAFITLTPDDLGALKGKPLRERARQNVLLELGQFIGRIGRKRVCLFIKGETEIPSDLGGVGYYRFHESVSERFLDIERELKAAGLI